MNSGNSEEAERAFREVLKKEPKHPAALNGLGQVFFGRRDYAGAEKQFKLASGGAPAAAYGLAKVYLLTERYELAVPILKKLANSSQRDAATGDLLAAAEKGELSARLRGLLEPPLPEVALGWQHLNAGRGPDAKTAFEAAVAKYPEDAGAQNGLGWYLLNSGEAEAACGAFEQALRLDPLATGAMNGWARALVQLDKLDEAIAQWTQMVEQEPKSAVALFGLVDACLAKQDYAQAQTWLEKLKVTNPNDPEVTRRVELVAAGAKSQAK